jgi:uncharacterized protein
MFVVELSFDDNPARLEIRPEHRKRLADLRERGVLRTAGPFADDSGALLIFDVDSADEVDRLMAEDPYYRAPGVTITSKRRWTPIIG